MLDSKFTFSIRAEQINQAAFGAVWSYSAASNLLIRQLAGAATGIGISDSYYTDAASDSHNTTLESNVTSGTFNSAAFTNHSLGLLRFTDPGPPVPSVFYDSTTPDYANHTFEFHGTCKPATLGDYVNHTSMNAARGGVPFGFDNYFVTAGYDPIGPGVIGINVNTISMTSTTTISPSVVASVQSSMPTNVINDNNKLRLFTHPNYVDASPGAPLNPLVLLIGWDGSTIYLENYTWDGSTINPLNNGTISTGNNMSYRGQHDIHYLNSGNILLQTWNSSRSAGILYEINGTSLVVVTSEVTTIVAYDPTFDIIGTRKTNGFQTYSGSLTTIAYTLPNVFTTAGIAYDALNHPDEPLAIYVGEEIPGTPGSLTSHLINYNPSGVINASTSFNQALSNSYPDFTQIERTSPYVLMNSTGPNNSTVNPVRTVCKSTKYKAVSTAIDYTDSNNEYYEDITQMRHPVSQDYKLTDTTTDSTIKGNNHLIASTYNGNVLCYGQNYCKAHWLKNNTSGSISAHHIYILYLGYYLDGGTGKDGYAYIVVSGLNSTFSLGNLTAAPPDGLIHWVNFRIN